MFQSNISPTLFFFAWNTLLGFHHAADTQAAGAPSKLRNKYVDDSAALSRGPAVTINSQMMRPQRNPVTGHNMVRNFSLGRFYFSF